MWRRARRRKGFSTPDLTVQPAPELNAVVIRGTPAAIASIEQLITDLDVRRPQVLIEAAIAEITGDDAEQLGVQLGTSGAVARPGPQWRGDLVQTGPARRWARSSPRWGAGGIALLGERAQPATSTIGDDFSILVQALGIVEPARTCSRCRRSRCWTTCRGRVRGRARTCRS
jgi:general secretion pathway protein D